MKKSMELTSGNLFKNIFIYSMPIVLSGILQLLFNACDLIVCGSFGSENSVGAISSTNSLINLLVNLFTGFSIGTNIMVARAYGMKNKEKIQKYIYSGLIISVVGGIILGIFGFVFSKKFLVLMKTANEVIDLSTDYLKIYFLGVPFLLIYNVLAAGIRATGDTKRPFYFLAIGGAINVLLNLLLVIVFKMDVKGVAIGTVASEAIALILTIIYLRFNKNEYLYFRFKKISFYKKEALQVIRVGLPAGVQGMIFSFSNVLIQSSINSLGVAVVNGNGTSSSLEGFIYTAMNSVAQACSAFVSANYGVSNKENIKKSLFYSCIIIVIMNILIAGIIIIFKDFLISLYIKDSESKIACLDRFYVIASTYFLCGFMDALAFALRGIGYSILPMIVSLIGACGFRIFWIYTIFKIEKFHTIAGLALSYPVSWIITSLFHLLFFVILFKKIYKTNVQKN